jgi:hypothetical protein
MNIDVIDKATQQLDGLDARAAATRDAMVQDIQDLPLIADAALLERRIQATQLEMQTIAQEKVETIKSELVDKLRSEIANITIPVLPIPPKLPLLNPKILQTTAMLRQLKQLITNRTAHSRTALKKGREMFSYPTTMKKRKIFNQSRS